MTSDRVYRAYGVRVCARVRAHVCVCVHVEADVGEREALGGVFSNIQLS